MKLVCLVGWIVTDAWAMERGVPSASALPTNVLNHVMQDDQPFFVKAPDGRVFLAIVHYVDEEMVSSGDVTRDEIDAGQLVLGTDSNPSMFVMQVEDDFLF